MKLALERLKRKLEERKKESPTFVGPVRSLLFGDYEYMFPLQKWFWEVFRPLIVEYRRKYHVIER